MLAFAIPFFFYEIYLSTKIIWRLQVIKTTFFGSVWGLKENNKGWDLKKEVVRKRAQQCGFNRQVKTKENLGGLKGNIIRSSRLVTFYVGEELFIVLCFPHGLLWDFDRKHMLFYVWQDGEDDTLGLRARQDFRALILPMQLVVFQLWLFKKLPLCIFSRL